jgi:hypothetical protein
VLARAALQAAPEVLREIDTHTRQAQVALQEVARQNQAERLRILDRLAGGERVHGILHRVGRQHAAVVAVGIRFVVVTRESDRKGEVVQVVAVPVPADLDDSHARLAIRRLSEHAALQEAEDQRRR